MNEFIAILFFGIFIVSFIGGMVTIANVPKCMRYFFVSMCALAACFLTVFYKVA